VSDIGTQLSMNGPSIIGLADQVNACDAGDVLL